MKKIWILLVAIIVSLLLMACSNPDNGTVYTFTGTVKEINGQSAIINVDEGEAIRSSGDVVSVRLSVNEDVEFKIGDRVKVGYDGEVREVYPLSINTIFIEIIEN